MKVFKEETANHFKISHQVTDFMTARWDLEHKRNLYKEVKQWTTTTRKMIPHGKWHSQTMTDMVVLVHLVCLFMTTGQLFYSGEQRFWCFACYYASLSAVKVSVFSCMVNISIPQPHCLTWRCTCDPSIQSDSVFGLWFPVKFLGWELYFFYSQGLPQSSF